MPISAVCSTEGGQADQDSITNNNDTTNTEGAFTDSRDNKTYKWVKFGDKVWMIENLQYLPEKDGFSVYNSTKPNIEKYGYLYTWERSKTVAPEGWHLPDNAEWAELISYFKTNSLNYDTIFNAQYGGYNDNSYFKSADQFGMWWSKDKYKENSVNISVYRISKGYNGLGKSGYSEDNLQLSVRCVKD